MKFSNDILNKIKKEITKDEYKLIYEKFIQKLENMDIDKIFGRKIETTPMLSDLSLAHFMI